MKRFGRGFSLDFEALMNEVRQPPQGGDVGGHGSPGDVDSTEGGSSAKNNYSRFNSYGSEDTISPVDQSTTPTEDDEGSGRIGGRMPTRMSVSRTGRCKNRNRQRLSVLQDEDIYRNGPSSSSSSDAAAGKAVKVTPSSTAAAANPKTSTGGGDRSQGRDSIASAGEAIDYDSALSALDKSIQATGTVVRADCYSF